MMPLRDLDAVAAAIASAVDEAHLEAPVVVGHSISGVIAAIYATTYAASGLVEVDQELDSSFVRLLQANREAVTGPGFAALWPGILASFLGFACFNYFFIPPFDTFAIGKGEDVVMLFAFLGLSVVIALLVTRSDARAAAAEARASELRMQQDLSRALVEPDTGPDRYAVVLRLIVSSFGFVDGVLFEQPHADLGGLEEMTVVNAEPGAIATTAGDGIERFPLNVGRRNLGLLVLRGDRAPLTASERRILEAFGNQLALLLERDRLLRGATPG